MKFKRYVTPRTLCYPLQRKFQTVDPLIIDVASLQRARRKLCKRERFEEKSRTANAISFYVNCLCIARKINPVLRRALPAAGFFFELFGYARTRARAPARAFSRDGALFRPAPRRAVGQTLLLAATSRQK